MIGAQAHSFQILSGQKIAGGPHHRRKQVAAIVRSHSIRQAMPAPIRATAPRMGASVSASFNRSRSVGSASRPDAICPKIP